MLYRMYCITEEPLFRPLTYLQYYIGRHQSTMPWSSSFVGSESCQKHGVKLLQNMVSNGAQQPPPPLKATRCLYILYFETGKGGGDRVEPERRLEGQ